MTVPLLYLRKIAMVRGQILFSALVVKAGSTVQTIQRVSMTKVRTSELNWAASCTSPSKTLGRNGCRTCVHSDSLSWSQYLQTRSKTVITDAPWIQGHKQSCENLHIQDEREANYPQIALTAEIRTEGGWLSCSPLTVAWRNCCMSSGDIAAVKRLAAHKARPNRKGEAAERGIKWWLWITHNILLYIT